jgi:hypothetical protein
MPTKTGLTVGSPVKVGQRKAVGSEITGMAVEGNVASLDGHEAYPQPVQNFGGQAVVRLEQPQQQVLGPQVAVAQAASFIRGRLDDMPGPGSQVELARGSALARLDAAFYALTDQVRLYIQGL